MGRLFIAGRFPVKRLRAIKLRTKQLKLGMLKLGMLKALFCGGIVLLCLLLGEERLSGQVAGKESAGKESAGKESAGKGSVGKGSVGEQLVGVWLTAKRDSRIGIVRSDDGTFSGKVVWVAPGVRNFVGVPVLRGVTYNKGTDSYSCPWVYDPKMGVTASGVANVSHDTLYIRAHKGFLSKTEFFTRVKQ
ncbi:MAG: DUF2147 domain-containing protein [Bacteroidales bacterium]|nr:DUF2147 domain-containing protein [Bacteroidales bacterium]